METKLWAVLLVLATTLLTSSAQLMYKLGVNALDSFSIINIITNYYLIGGILLYVIGGTAMIISFRGGDLTVLYPIFSTGFIWVGFMSTIFLGESMNLFKWLGIFGIVAGITFIGYGSKVKKEAHLETV